MPIAVGEIALLLDMSIVETDRRFGRDSVKFGPTDARTTRSHASGGAIRGAVGGETRPAGAEHVVGGRNRWSRVVLPFAGLASGQWYEFSACVVCAAGEAAADAKDLAALGLVCHAQDRSEIDFARVPGLARTSMDAHGDWIAGPASAGAGARAVVVRRCFYLPAPAAAVTVVIRSWRNSHPFRLIDPELRPAMPGATPDAAGDAEPAMETGRLPDALTRDGRIALGPRPVWYRHGLVPGRALVFKGR